MQKSVKRERDPEPYDKMKDRKSISKMKDGKNSQKVEDDTVFKRLKDGQKHITKSRGTETQK
jgi:hypothetical protein